MTPTDVIAALLVFGFLLLSTYVGGGVVAWIVSVEARRDRAELRQDRQTLLKENRELVDDKLRLREEMLELRSQLATAIQEINQLTAVTDGREDSAN